MIRLKKPQSPRRILEDRLRAIRSEIRAYEAPSDLGARHDAHVRDRWDAHIELLRACEDEVIAQIEALA